MYVPIFPYIYIYLYKHIIYRINHVYVVYTHIDMYIHICIYAWYISYQSPDTSKFRSLWPGPIWATRRLHSRCCKNPSSSVSSKLARKNPINEGSHNFSRTCDCITCSICITCIISIRCLICLICLICRICLTCLN